MQHFYQKKRFLKTAFQGENKQYYIWLTAALGNGDVSRAECCLKKTNYLATFDLDWSKWGISLFALQCFV